MPTFNIDGLSRLTETDRRSQVIQALPRADDEQKDGSRGPMVLTASKGSGISILATVRAREFTYPEPDDKRAGFTSVADRERMGRSPGRAMRARFPSTP